MKYTKGEWYYNSYDKIFCGNVSKGEKIDLIATISHLGDKSLGDEIHGKRAKEARANAKLIASAPELLEACKWAKSFLEGLFTYGGLKDEDIEPANKYHKQLEQAIQKAENNNL